MKIRVKEIAKNLNIKTNSLVKEMVLRGFDVCPTSSITISEYNLLIVSYFKKGSLCTYRQKRKAIQMHHHYEFCIKRFVELHHEETADCEAC